MTKLFQFALVLATFIGAYFLFQEIQLSQYLKTEYSRLAVQYGDLDIKDRTQFCVVACPDNTTRHFRWRMFVPELPAGHGQVRIELGAREHTVTRTPHEESEIEFEIRFGHTWADTPELYHNWGRNGGFGYRFSPPLHEFLSKHWDQLEFKVLGEDGQVDVDLTELVPLFSVSVPPELTDQIPPEMKQRQEEHGVYPIFELKVGEIDTITSELSKRNLMLRRLEEAK